MMPVNAISGKPFGSQPRGEDGCDLKREAEEDGADAEAGAEVFRGEDAGEEAGERDQVGDDVAPVTTGGGDAEEDDVAGHGVGEDVAVVEVDDGIEQAAGGRQEHGVGERVGLDGAVVRRHGGGVDRGTSQRVS
jgi:hypothetical protein